MIFIDTHAHLYDEAFDGDIGDVIGNAVAAGVTRMVFPDIDSSSRERMFSLAATRPDMFFPSLGLHPTSVNAGWEEEFEKMLGFRDRKIWAIGETGMDCWWSKEFVEEQKACLRRHAELAHETGLPLIIHSREATAPIIEVLESCRRLNLKGVFHAFSGSIETFRILQRLGDWYVGIGGVLTYKNASIASTLKEIPLDRILLETDSPYLPPVPYRGTRNESSHIPVIAAKVAEIKGTGIEEVAERTTGNAVRLFGLPEPCGQRRETL